jgi:hypothetical protein
MLVEDKNIGGFGSVYPKLLDGGSIGLRLAPSNIINYFSKNLPDEDINLIFQAILAHEAITATHPELDEKKEFEEKDKGNIKLYIEKEKKTWDIVMTKFPQLKPAVESICRLLFR